MRHVVLALFLVAGSLYAQQTTVPEIRYHSVPDFLKLPPDLYFGEVRRRRGQFQGTHFCFLAGKQHRPSLWSERRTTARVRRQRQVRA